MHQIKRLDIICKSKGLPRPKRDFLQQSQERTNTYVSPYQRNRVSPGMSGQRSMGSGTRNMSNNNRVSPTLNRNSAGGANKFTNRANYTPPNR